MVDEQGAPVDLSDPSVAITLTARRSAVGGDLLFPPRLAVVNLGAGTGRADILIADSDTASLEPGSYAFDVWMQMLGDDQPLLPVSPLLIAPSLFSGPGSLAPPIVPPSPNPFISGTGQWSVPAPVPVGALVRVSGPFQAALASNVAEASAPAIGVVLAKPTPTTATLAYLGTIDLFAGLTLGADYFLGVNGAIVDAGGLPVLPGEVVQLLGKAVSATSLLLNPEPMVVL